MLLCCVGNDDVCYSVLQAVLDVLLFAVLDVLWICWSIGPVAHRLQVPLSFFLVRLLRVDSFKRDGLTTTAQSPQNMSDKCDSWRLRSARG
jgi:hypothetical protein